MPSWIEPVRQIDGELTVDHRDPRMATPVTAPSSRAVLIVEAATPEFAAGMLIRAVALTGTTMMPKPMPASPMVQPSVLSPAWGPMTTSVRRTPEPGQQAAHRHGHAGSHPPDPATGKERRDDHPGQERKKVDGRGVGTHRRDHLEIERDEEEDGKDGEVTGKGDHRRAG